MLVHLSHYLYPHQHYDSPTPRGSIERQILAIVLSSLRVPLLPSTIFQPSSLLWRLHSSTWSLVVPSFGFPADSISLSVLDIRVIRQKSLHPHQTEGKQFFRLSRYIGLSGFHFWWWKIFFYHTEGIRTFGKGVRNRRFGSSVDKCLVVLLTRVLLKIKQDSEGSVRFGSQPSGAHGMQWRKIVFRNLGLHTSMLN